MMSRARHTTMCSRGHVSCRAGPRSRLPRPVRPFRPPLWLPGPHLPTIWGKKLRRQRLVHDRLERLRTEDGDHLTLARMGVARAGTPHLLVVHGLEATLSSNYAHGLLSHAGRLGWSGDFLLFRSCDDAANSARRLYHSGETTDLDFVVRRLRGEAPDSPLLICGVSLGGNVLLKWLGELGEAARSLVHRAAAVSVPFDLAAGSRYLERGFSQVYARHFLTTLKAKAIAKARQFPDSIDVDRVIAAKTFWEFDDAVTAPLHGFADAGDYYSRSSSALFLPKVLVPTLLFSALDDPIVPRSVNESVLRQHSSSTVLTCDFTARGGHVGWVEGLPWSQTFYMEERIVEYLSK
jgi:predicted alpha/beta-fold hydrolase